jgi:hypothetical protein
LRSAASPVWKSGAEGRLPRDPPCRSTAVINAFPEVILDVFGDVVGQHARTAIGVAALPLNLPVVVAAELSLAPAR